MPGSEGLKTNFACLAEHDDQLLRIGMLAERYFPDDPNTCLLKLRQLAELLARITASYAGIYEDPEESQYQLLSRLRDRGIVPSEIHQLFGEVRRTGNTANHSFSGDHKTALSTLRICWQISVWFHRTFKSPQFKSGAFVPPRPPADESEELRDALDRAKKQLAAHKEAHVVQSEKLGELVAQLTAAQNETAFWEGLAAEAEAEKNQMEARLASQQADNASKAAADTAKIVRSANEAAKQLELDETATRRLIDAQLAQAGWTVDSEILRFSKGTRPEKGKFMAIAEWPTSSGPADYVLFLGLTPVGTVEAKRKNLNVSSALQQAKRYSRDFSPSDEVELPARNWGANGEFRLPFVFSTNGRPFLRQLETHSGIWFCDLRRPENLGHALHGWLSPEGLAALLKQDTADADKKLETEPFDFGFVVRDYQQAAIRETDRAIAAGQREILLAMATGTGKTKTCIALIYRFLKTKRFRRILFLVDRSALGEQAANSFKDTRMENLNTFAEIFGIKELEDQAADSDTAVHIATVQGMVQRVLYPGENSSPPPVDEYDCIVVDECHRGYLLDRELSETELTFRSYDDYISKYRRVLDWFVATKIGLTATPALHTSEIFGPPVFTYSYREAVIDGHLTDHDPPLRITTELSKNGIKWKKGDKVSVYNPTTTKVELHEAPDSLAFDVKDFNKKVLTKSFNQVVCKYLASEIDPASPRKTLVFCANDTHADLVVLLLKKAFKRAYGSVDDDAVIKITGTADKPLKLIRRFKNEKLPNVAVTVDLLTTGIDVPAICNLVFLRRVNSRILYDQMLGRATRRCDEIEKETFRIFDAVRIYETMQAVSSMKPVVVNTSISFSQLERETSTAPTPEALQLVREQFVAKLHRKKRNLSEKAAADFETRAGMSAEAFAKELGSMPLENVAAWFAAHPGLGEILDRKNDLPSEPIFISGHKDKLADVVSGYGDATKPEDYLDSFGEFIRSHANDLPALKAVLTRPRELTRKDLRELLLTLDQAGFTEAALSAAWKQMTNQEIAARIIGYIRQAALGDPLVPFTERVDHALQSLLASRPWTSPQRDWLKKLAAQTKANFLVDRAALDDPALLFKRDGGGFKRLNKIFDGEFGRILDEFNDSVWTQAR